jgi:hypothetical protein
MGTNVSLKAQICPSQLKSVSVYRITTAQIVEFRMQYGLDIMQPGQKTEKS